MMHSVYRPLLVKFTGYEGFCTTVKPFKFQIVLLAQADFGNLVQESWRNNKKCGSHRAFKHRVMS